MYERFCLCLVALLNICFVSGQAIHYDYDSNGNRTQKYIVISKGYESVPINIDKKETTVEYREILEEVIVRIYPNPTDGNLFVEFSGMAPEKSIDYHVISQSGNILEKKNKAGTSFDIDFSKYQSGVYFLILSVGDKISQWRIVKE